MLYAANESVGNPESSGEDTSDSDDDTSANGPEAVEHVCIVRALSQLLYGIAKSDLPIVADVTVM